MTFAEFSEGYFIWGSCPWIKRQHAKGRSFSEAMTKTRRGHLVNYLIPSFGTYKLSDIKRITVENWLVNLPLANQTKNQILYTFRILLSEAEMEELIPRNPLDKVEALGDTSKTRDVFTIDEYKMLATTGIRLGELRALTWKDVLWDGGLIIDKAVKVDQTIGTTKTNQIRVVPLTSRAVSLLDDWKRKSPFPSAEDYIFFGLSGDKPLDRGTLIDTLRKVARCLAQEGVTRKQVWRIMHKAGLRAIYPKYNLSKPKEGGAKYPYLLKDKAIWLPNQVWASDITDIRVSSRTVYLVTIIDVYSRKVLSWQLSNTMDAGFCVAALEEAIRRYGIPSIFNTDQGSQFSSAAFLTVLQGSKLS
jgi:hypothetical protein